MGSRFHIHIYLILLPWGRVQAEKRVGNSTRAFYLFEDHDIATLIIFPEGEGCQTSHFHHIVSGEGEPKGKRM